jgi:hypothetical protein
VSTQALAMQALHRVRQGYGRRRTALGNQMRGLLLEHDIVIAKDSSKNNLNILTRSL